MTGRIGLAEEYVRRLCARYEKPLALPLSARRPRCCLPSTRLFLPLAGNYREACKEAAVNCASLHRLWGSPAHRRQNHGRKNITHKQFPKLGHRALCTHAWRSDAPSRSKATLLECRVAFMLMAERLREFLFCPESLGAISVVTILAGRCQLPCQVRAACWWGGCAVTGEPWSLFGLDSQSIIFLLYIFQSEHCDQWLETRTVLSYCTLVCVTDVNSSDQSTDSRIFESASTQHVQQHDSGKCSITLCATWTPFPYQLLAQPKSPEVSKHRIYRWKVQAALE